MTAPEFKAVDDVSTIPEGTIVRVGEPDIIHRPDGRVTGKLLTNDIENGIFQVETSSGGYNPFTKSDLDGHVSDGAGHNEKVFVKEA